MKDKSTRPAEHKPISLHEMVKRLLDMPPASSAKKKKKSNPQKKLRPQPDK